MHRIEVVCSSLCKGMFIPVVVWTMSSTGCESSCPAWTTKDGGICRRNPDLVTAGGGGQLDVSSASSPTQSQPGNAGNGSSSNAPGGAQSSSSSSFGPNSSAPGANAGGSGSGSVLNPNQSNLNGGATSSNAGSGGESASQPGTNSTCLSTELMCNGTCVLNDSRNCGKCGHDCTRLPNVAGAVSCSPDGMCAFDGNACATGTANCSMDAETGCDTDIKTAEHCGDCQTVCSGSTPMCAGQGGCVSGCPDTLPMLCGKTCVDVTNDAKNCGQCGKQCQTTAARAEPVCRNGSCGFECSNGLTACTDACVDLKTDNQHCGGCDTACVGGKMCSSGICICPNGTHDCNGKCADDNALATCGKACSACSTSVRGAQPTCKSAQCSYMCPSNTKDCGSACVDTNSDNNNCGSCNQRCNAGQSCVGSICVCPFGTHDCSGRCLDNSSTDSCGLMCTACPRPTSGNGITTCNGVTCDFTCSSGVKCGSACVDTSHDAKNCGGCNNACKVDQVCMEGECVCLSGTHLCSDGRCHDDSDINSCGNLCAPCPNSTNGIGTPTCSFTSTGYACGLACPSGTGDCSGACTSSC